MRVWFLLLIATKTLPTRLICTNVRHYIPYTLKTNVKIDKTLRELVKVLHNLWLPLKLSKFQSKQEENVQSQQKQPQQQVHHMTLFELHTLK